MNFMMDFKNIRATGNIDFNNPLARSMIKEMAKRGREAIEKKNTPNSYDKIQRNMYKETK